LSKIKILSEHLANQIAAGEVIERPASVVKELLENSIDADAGQIHVDIGGNGTKLIRVMDDGVGMDADDALLCLERHATSKLGESGDDSGRLSAINSLGFRGEAIPSIGSVAKMSLTTRTGDDPLGTRIEVRYGKIMKVHETGCNKGTVIEIRDLFGNMPARKKFLKSNRTELFHIEEAVKNYALANYRLGITYRVNNNTVLNFTTRSDTLEDRVRMLYTKNSSVPLLSLSLQDEGDAPDDRIFVSGFLLSPEHSSATANRLRLFVNGRAVKDRMMAHAVSEGFSGYMMKGRSAAGAVFITVPYEMVDVNVHPTKQEIRFRQPDLIHAKIASAVRNSLHDHQQTVKQTIFGHNLEQQKAAAAELTLPAEKAERSVPKTKKLWKSIATAEFQKNPALDVTPAESKTGLQDSDFTPRESRNYLETAEPEALFIKKQTGKTPVPEVLRPIGQFMDLYLLCEAKSEKGNHLVVIDQHAVHERILFENLKKQFAARQMARQSLLFPKMVELSPEYATILEKNRDQLERLGLVVEAFGGDSFIIKAIPAVVSHIAPEEILTGILAEYTGFEHSQEQKRKRSDAARLEDILSTMACKAAIKAGQNLDMLEIQELLKLMQDSSAFTHCPHGRPVVRMFSEADIKKWFHRT